MAVLAEAARGDAAISAAPWPLNPVKRRNNAINSRTVPRDLTHSVYRVSLKRTLMLRRARIEFITANGPNPEEPVARRTREVR
jgi:hypothetical protein